MNGDSDPIEQQNVTVKKEAQDPVVGEKRTAQNLYIDLLEDDEELEITDPETLKRMAAEAEERKKKNAGLIEERKRKKAKKAEEDRQAEERKNSCKTINWTGNKKDKKAEETEDAKKAAEDAKKAAEDAKKAAEDAKKAEEARQASENAKKAAEDAKKAEEAKKAEDSKKAAEDAKKAAEDAKKAENARQASENAKKALENATKAAADTKGAEVPMARVVGILPLDGTQIPCAEEERVGGKEKPRHWTEVQAEKRDLIKASIDQFKEGGMYYEAINLERLDGTRAYPNVVQALRTLEAYKKVNDNLLLVNENGVVRGDHEFKSHKLFITSQAWGTYMSNNASTNKIADHVFLPKMQQNKRNPTKVAAAFVLIWNEYYKKENANVGPAQRVNLFKEPSKTKKAVNATESVDQDGHVGGKRKETPHQAAGETGRLNKKGKETPKDGDDTESEDSESDNAEELGELTKA
jgi:hypothetical protein